MDLRPCKEWQWQWQLVQRSNTSEWQSPCNSNKGRVSCKESDLAAAQDGHDQAEKEVDTGRDRRAHYCIHQGYDQV